MQQQQQLMDVDAILHLFDSYWFELEVFGENNHPSSSLFSSIAVQKNFPAFSRVPTTLVRSLSDQLSTQSSFKSSSLSPDSVLNQRKLETITSGKETTILQDKEFDFSSSSSPSPPPTNRVSKHGGTRRKMRVSRCKSLTRLEFEELQGFMDLGFVFSEEDKDSTLVSIVPGLQRLGNGDKHGGKEKISDVSRCEVSRPYLSEAWEYWDEKRMENPLINWRVPSLGNETDIKDSLKWWAHTVASTVR